MMKFPFASKKVPVCSSVSELEKFLNKFKDYSFCLYVAYKDSDGWSKSTSRVYMNKVLPYFIYVPVNIKRGDYAFLRKVYNIAMEDKRIVAINQTQPHKSNPVLKRLFSNVPNLPVNIDAIIKNEKGDLIPFDLNGPSFAGWFNDEVGSFTDKVIILVGVGGVGEPIARRIVLDNPKKLILVDLVSKQGLQKELSVHCHVEYYHSLSSVRLGSVNDLVVINAAGKEGVLKDSSFVNLLKKFKGKGFIFVDLRPFLKVKIVEEAKSLGWRAFTGYGMNSRNDYSLYIKIASILGVKKVMTFSKFKKLVAEAS